MNRRHFLTAILGAILLSPPALASGGGGGNGEIYTKIPTINVEFWDEQGIFHMVVIDAVVVFHEQTKVDKVVSISIANALSAMPWEEFSRGNPAATVKAIALDLVRKQPGAEKAIEVLLSRLVMR